MIWPIGLSNSVFKVMPINKMLFYNDLGPPASSNFTVASESGSRYTLCEVIAMVKTQMVKTQMVKTQ
jgi:hypothetical protein